MKDNTSFDRHLTINAGRIPADVHEAAVFVADTLDLAWLATQAVFEDRATPDLAIAVFDRIARRMLAQSSLEDAQAGR